MKYQQGKIKREHHVIKEFEGVLDAIARLSYIQRIIPGRIYRSQQGTSRQNMTLSYHTNTGAKCMMKKGGTAQEVFLIYAEHRRKQRENDIQHISM